MTILERAMRFLRDLATNEAYRCGANELHNWHVSDYYSAMESAVWRTTL